ncbi:hypothetical protein GCM10020366_11220 [Saccharopolyspora gregorii]|uniref:Uncharacterized protein n=1 Tax=Saccharopolyspora gregorii TaxID=33914 RepID=A0ABP6RLD7_9PSEU
MGLRWGTVPVQNLLNLAFSNQASYAAPLILLAQNRQDDRERGVDWKEDTARGAEQTKADTEYLARELAALRWRSARSPPRLPARPSSTGCATSCPDTESGRARRRRQGADGREDA